MGGGRVDNSDTSKSSSGDMEHLPCRTNLCLANQRKKYSKSKNVLIYKLQQLPGHLKVSISNLNWSSRFMEYPGGHKTYCPIILSFVLYLIFKS